MTEAAHAAYWAALGANGGATLLYAVGASFKARRALQGALAALALGLGLLTVSLALRWTAIGHGPYLGRYEALASYAWALMAMYLLLQWRVPSLRLAGLLAAPVAFLLLGAGVLSPAAPQFESPAMRSAWLWVHVGMAKVALASFVVSAGVSAAALRRMRDRGAAVSSGDADGSPSSDDLTEWSTRLASLGFLVLAVVIGAGALWANTAWGSYWSWDPIETWALGTWVLYGGLLHLHRMWSVVGARWAWLNLGALAASAVLFLAMRTLSLSPHWIYLD